jgi:hypothetical protein
MTNETSERIVTSSLYPPMPMPKLTLTPLTPLTPPTPQRLSSG